MNCFLQAVDRARCVLLLMSVSCTRKSVSPSYPHHPHHPHLHSHPTTSFSFTSLSPPTCSHTSLSRYIPAASFCTLGSLSDNILKYIDRFLVHQCRLVLQLLAYSFLFFSVRARDKYKGSSVGWTLYILKGLFHHDDSMCMPG